MKLTYEILYKMFHDCYQNGKDLLEESKILFFHGKYQRAYTLAHFSTEETSKLPMLNTYMIGIMNNHKYDTNHLLKRLRNHTAKIEMYQMILDWDDDFSIEELKSLVTELNDKKNNSIYVSIFDTGYRTPKEEIGKKDAEDMINSASYLLDFHERFVRYTMKELKNLQTSELYDNLYAEYKEK
ncbi:AbiV family abortive infection protein [Neobacillus niacini]|uniref:AbiV family abortive infection protein n=1 Tax=Neobacillus niacini TaxID=86668 RepID=UPI0006944BF3|nr:AbiV family abortive infection protein [Neobacillus niacini]